MNPHTHVHTYLHIYICTRANGSQLKSKEIEIVFKMYLLNTHKYIHVLSEAEDFSWDICNYGVDAFSNCTYVNSEVYHKPLYIFYISNDICATNTRFSLLPMMTTALCKST